MKKLIDIHLHLDGSVPFQTAKKLCHLHHLPELSDFDLAKRLSVSKDCHDLNEYLDKFNFPLMLMQTKGDLEMIVFDLLKKLRQEGLVYTEIRFAPQKHTDKGLSQKDAVLAAISGLNHFLSWQKNLHDGRPELHAGFILCLMRMPNNDLENAETVEVARDLLGKGVVGLDLAGAEMPVFANKNYADFFKQAQNWDIPFTIHAGEAMGPESIKEALSMGAKRIGHGIRCIEDPDLVDWLIQNKVTLECCATSNMNTKVFTSFKDYPIRTLLHKGVRATLNTDNMTVSATNLPLEYQRMENFVGLTNIEIRQLYLNAIDAAFTSNQEKNRLRNILAYEDILNAAFTTVNTMTPALSPTL